MRCGRRPTTSSPTPSSSSAIEATKASLEPDDPRQDALAEEAQALVREMVPKAAVQREIVRDVADVTDAPVVIDDDPVAGAGPRTLSPPGPAGRPSRWTTLSTDGQQAVHRGSPAARLDTP